MRKVILSGAAGGVVLFLLIICSWVLFVHAFTGTWAWGVAVEAGWATVMILTAVFGLIALTVEVVRDRK